MGERRRLRLLLGAFGDPGHTFPIIALGRALRARGHEVVVQTWHHWQDDVEREGLGFAPAPEYRRPAQAAMQPYEAALHGTRDTTLPLLKSLRPHAVVADILTLAPALSAELQGVPWATLVPHVHPMSTAGSPPFSTGARLPRTAAGRGIWNAVSRATAQGLRRGRSELNETRRRLGLPPLGHTHGGISRSLCLVASFPQLEYPRSWMEHEHVVGPLLWEPPSAEVAMPESGAPLVLIAPSTSKDRDHRLLRAALAGLRDAPVRVLATWNRRAPRRALPTAANASVVEWMSYARTMPHADAVICHGGHGTVVRALSAGAPVIACPADGDMHENAARVDWAGVGVRVPRLLTTPGGLRLAVARVLSDGGIRDRAGALGAWAAAHDGATRAAELVEGLATGGLTRAKKLANCG